MPSTPRDDVAVNPLFAEWPLDAQETVVEEVDVRLESVSSDPRYQLLTSRAGSEPLPTSPQPAALPSREHLQQLVDLYFEKFYKYLPILHKPTLMSKLQSGDYADSHLLLFSIMAVSSSAHPDRAIQRQQTPWYNHARNLFTQAAHTLSSPFQAVVSAAFIIFQSIIATEYSAAWTTLGDAWRLAVMAGFNLQDAAAQTVRHALGPSPCRGWVEREECRRAVWVLFVCDRGMCFPIGLTHAIDDRQMRLDFPMSEDRFQAVVEPDGREPLQYTHNLDRLITLVQTRARAKTATPLQFIVLAYIFLGRVSECIYALDDDDAQEQKKRLDALTSHLLRIRLMLPRSATDLAAAPSADFSSVVWLNVVLAAATILLHHRALLPGQTLSGPNDLATNWPHCVAAARGTVATIRDAARSSTEFVVNPHLSAKLFTCGRVLVMEYLCPSTTKTRDGALRDDLEVLFATFERLREALKGVGSKFRNGLLFYMREDERHVLESKAGGSRGLLNTCERWPQVEDVEYVPFPS